MRGGQHEAASGHLTLFNPQEVHDGVPSREGYSYCVTYPSIALLTTIAGEVSGRVVSGLPFFREPVVHDPQGVALLTQAHHALEEGSDTLAADELLVRAYGYCLTQHAHIIPAVLGCEVKSVARVKELLALRSAEDLTLQELAAEAELSCYHLIRSFHHATGLTPHAYLVNQRIEAAKERLRRGENLVEIAAATGFSDQAHLTRVFNQGPRRGHARRLSRRRCTMNDQFTGAAAVRRPLESRYG
jgi:AraC-like DNA-binding protein